MVKIENPNKRKACSGKGGKDLQGGGENRVARVVNIFLAHSFRPLVVRYSVQLADH